MFTSHVTSMPLNNSLQFGADVLLCAFAGTKTRVLSRNRGIKEKEVVMTDGLASDIQNALHLWDTKSLFFF